MFVIIVNNIPNSLWRFATTGAALTWMGIIFYVSSLSQESASDTIRLGDFGSYAAHFGAYAILATLFSLSIWGWKLGYQLRWVAIAAVFAVLYGVSDEFHQPFVVGRSATIADVIADAIGATFSATCLWFVVKLSKARRT